MAFTDPIVLADNTPTNQNFTRKPQSVLMGADYVEDDSTSALERILLIRHSNAGPSNSPGSPPKQRHLVTFGLKKYNSLTSKTDVFNINWTILDDPGSSITLTEKRHILAFLRSMAVDANMDKLLRGEA